MKLAMFSPLSPVRSGISDYTEELLPALAQRAEVHVFIDDYRPANPAIAERFAIHNYRGFPEHDRREQYDLVLYQMGNNAIHRYMYTMLNRSPGVVVLHDLVLHHLIAAITVGEGNPGAYLREMVFAYGAAGQELARRVVRAEQEPPFFTHPLFDRTVRLSLGAVGHSAYVARAVARRCPQVPVAQAPMGMPVPPLAGDPRALRERLGLDRGAFIVASFGEATPHKRLMEGMRAFAVLHRNHRDARYVIVGNRAPSLDLDGLAASLGISDAVRVTGYVSRAEFDAYLQAVDVCMNLRYPTAGETSASALRCMAAGRPTIISDIGANMELPDAACIKVPVGVGEQEAIIASLERLREDSQERRALGERARSYVETEHTLDKAADAYIRFAQQIVSGTAVSADIALSEAAPAATVSGEVARELTAMGVGGADTTLMREVGAAMWDVGLRNED